MTQAFELQPGVEAFPGYWLHLPVGRGGCGEVWETIGPDGRHVALKFMRCKESTAAAREIRSIQALRRLRHPGLTCVDQVFLQAGYVVVAMELADGSLMDLLEVYSAEHGTPLPAPDTVRLLAQAAEAIDFLNAARHSLDGRTVGYQHGDVKPSNLLVFGDRVKLADYGLAVPMTAPSAVHGRCGTLEFAPPEIFQGQISDRADQYALAVSYCLLRGGGLPFADTPARFNSGYVRPQPDLTMLPAAERPAVARALAFAPIARWPSCTAFIDQLRRIVEPARPPRNGAITVA